MTKIQTERLLARAGLVLIALVGADAARASEDRKRYATGTAGFVTQSDQQLDYTRPGVAGVTSRTLRSTSFISQCWGSRAATVTSPSGGSSTLRSISSRIFS